MGEIEVRLHPPTAQGRLYYYPDPEIDDTLLVLNPAEHQTPKYIFSTEDTMIFNLSAERLLIRVRILCGRQAWKIGPRPAQPATVQAADLEFTEATIQQQRLHLHTRVITDSTKTYAVIYFGDPEEIQTWVELSPRVFALLTEHRLKGFVVHLR